MEIKVVKSIQLVALETGFNFPVIDKVVCQFKSDALMSAGGYIKRNGESTQVTKVETVIDMYRNDCPVYAVYYTDTKYLYVKLKEVTSEVVDYIEKCLDVDSVLEYLRTNNLIIELNERGNK